MSAARIAAVRGEGLPVLLAGLALAATWALLLFLASDLGFLFDEWSLLLDRRGFNADVFLAPHNEHIALATTAIFKTLLAAFGMDSPSPFYAVTTLAFVVAIAVVFVYLRHRVGAWLALAGILPLLAFGPGWDALLITFQIGFTGSLACGIGALLALEREDRAGDVAATVLLVLCMCFSSLGIPFAAGAAVAIATRPGWRDRVFVVAVPVVLFGLWWLGWGHDARNWLSLTNLERSPVYVLDGFASSLASLLGQARSEGFDLVALDWGRPLLAAALVLAALRLRRLGTLPRGVLIAGSVAVLFWFLVAVNANPVRTPTTGRYQLIGAILVLLVVAELARGTRPSTAVKVALVLAAAAAGLHNAEELRAQWIGAKTATRGVRAELAAVELARGRVAPGFSLEELDTRVPASAASYLSAVDAFGSPAYDPGELAAAPEDARLSADRTFAKILDLAAVPAPDARLSGQCRAVRPSAADAATGLALPEGGALLRAREEGELRLRRYASASFPVELGALPAGVPVTLSIPPDSSAEPWELDPAAAGALTVCPIERR